MPRSEHGPKCHDCGDRLDSYSEEDRSGNQREAAAHNNRGAIELDASRGRSRVHHGRWTRGRRSRTFRTVIRTSSPGGSPIGLRARRLQRRLFRSGPRAPGPPVRAPNRSTLAAVLPARGDRKRGRSPVHASAERCRA